MPPYVSYVEATNRKTRKKLYIECDNEADNEKNFDKSGLVGSTAEATAVTFSNNSTYTFRIMNEEEFKLAEDSQKKPYPKTNPKKKGKVGEKWLTESMQHSGEFHNASVEVSEVVAKNVDAFNKHNLHISKFHPLLYVNKMKVLGWIRRNKVQLNGIGIWIAINLAYITILIIDDEGSFGESIQIAFGEMVGAELGAVIGAEIGVALGSIVPVWGNLIIGLIGSFIGALIGGGIVLLARYLFCVAPASPGPGVPILDTDPYPTYTGIPDQGLDDNVYGVPHEEYNRGAFGIPSMGLDTGAFGTPESEYRTRRM